MPSTSSKPCIMRNMSLRASLPYGSVLVPHKYFFYFSISTLWTVDYTLQSVDYTFWSVKSTLQTVDYTLWTVDYTLQTVDYTLQSVDFTLQTVDYTLQIL